MLIFAEEPGVGAVWKLFQPETGRFLPVSFADGVEALFRGIPSANAWSAEAHRATAGRSGMPELPSSVRAPFGGSKILCVGRNYRPHAEELGNTIPTEPLWFSKPPSSLLEHRGIIQLPAEVGRIDYEGEMAILIGRSGRNIPAESALSHVCGVTAALDITARELQKKDGQWTRAKGFDTFCPLGPGWIPFHPDWESARITTELNDRVVQQDSLTSLIFPLSRLIEHISSCMTLVPGDVILTGTPAGVGEIKDGDHLRVRLDGPVSVVLDSEVRPRMKR
jgi:2-keto-4-pentenoate hydratase/2-oxohepta-3-ene-1,7-dioic acid hydratase in catechol pathway